METPRFSFSQELSLSFESLAFLAVASPPKLVRHNSLPPPPRSQFLADLAKAMVDTIFCVFQDFGVYRRFGDPELDFALGQWW